MKQETPAFAEASAGKQNLITRPAPKGRGSLNEVERPPVVVVLGHVDHGKSSLLEAAKEFIKITKKESGGITQHIGAYEIEHQGKKITFLDTPGHEAFFQMRSRGAKMADIAILVVAADEGVKAQTKEAISHIKKTGIPTIVALNKIDKSEADPARAKRELVKEGILVESMAGKIPSVEVSAKTGKGISDLLELILLVAEMENLKTDISKPAEGVVIEAYLDALRGPTATLIPFQGILKPGKIIGTPSTFGKIKSLENFQGISVPEVFPSMPAIIIGFDDVPGVGEQFREYSDAEEAQKNIKKQKEKISEVLHIEPDKKVLNLILKADVLGSLEAIEEVLIKLPQEKVILRVLKAEVGEINESDIKLAKGANARILGFRVKVNPTAKELVERGKIKIRNFDVIYELIQNARELMEKSVEPEIVRSDLGKVKILAVFLTDKNRQIIGGKVIEGEVRKGASIEVFRPASPAKRGEEEEKMGQGKPINLQKNKKDAARVVKGEECGILFEGNVRIEEGDILVFYTEEKRRGEL